jgi:rubredoxin
MIYQCNLCDHAYTTGRGAYRHEIATGHTSFKLVVDSG